MSTFTIKGGSYCPVCVGVCLADHKHEVGEYPHRGNNPALERRNSELTAESERRMNGWTLAMQNEKDLEDKNHELTARIAELEHNYEEEKAIVSRIWEMFGNPSYESLNGRSIYDLITEARKDGQRIDAIIANKWTISWNYLRDSFIVQAKDQVCGNIGHSKPLRELLDDAATPLPEKEGTI